MSNETKQLGSGDTLMPQIMESVLMVGDLGKLSPSQRVQYYGHVCESIGLNPLTKPFDYITLNGKLTLYATKNCTDQLRNRDSVSIKIVSRELMGDVFIVTAQASKPDGRVDESTGAIYVKGASGEALANLYMKCETKAKRRVTLSICGMGILDETEIESVPNLRHVRVDQQGQISEGTGFVPPETRPTEKQKEQEKPAAPAKSKDYAMMEAFGRVKKEIGDEQYYAILKQHGFAHCDEITDSSVGRDIFREMKKAQAPVQQVEEEVVSQ